jgi:hypothetical protein
VPCPRVQFASLHTHNHHRHIVVPRASSLLPRYVSLAISCNRYRSLYHVRASACAWYRSVDCILFSSPRMRLFVSRHTQHLHNHNCHIVVSRVSLLSCRLSFVLRCNLYRVIHHVRASTLFLCADTPTPPQHRRRSQPKLVCCVALLPPISHFTFVFQLPPCMDLYVCLPSNGQYGLAPYSIFL